MTDCLFCKIISGDIPSKKIFEDDLVFAFLDIHPWSRGHTLIIPKRHAGDIHDIDDESLQRIVLTAKELAGLYDEKLGADGYNLHQSNGAAAQQEVFHFHMHLIPRYEEAGLMIVAQGIDADVDLEAVYAKLAI